MKSLYHTLLCCLLLSVVMSFSPKNVIAQSQETGCVPRKQANRDKVWRFESYTVLESEYRIEQNKIRIVHGAKEDSIYFQGQSSTIVSTFITDKEGRILSPVTFDYVEDGNMLTDSIVPGKKGKSKYYFDKLFYTDALLLKVDLIKNAEWYYNEKGQDSLLIVSFEGDVSLMSWFRDGKDSLERRWNAKGGLIYEKAGQITQKWNDEQRLIEKAFDTLIKGNTVECIKSWYPSGVLKSVRYFYFDVACLDWEYYNEQGKLVQLLRKKRLDEITPMVYAIDPAPIRVIQVQDEDVAQVFKQELNRKLSEILCRTKIKPEGTYQVQVWLEASGKLILNKLDGEYADVIGPEMETFFRELTGARPAQRNGRPYAQLLQLTLKVSDKGK